jgi:hypothetical protein
MIQSSGDGSPKSDKGAMHRKQPKLVDVGTSRSLGSSPFPCPVRLRRAGSSGSSVGVRSYSCVPILHRHTQSDISLTRFFVLGVVAAKLKLLQRRVESSYAKSPSLSRGFRDLVGKKRWLLGVRKPSSKTSEGGPCGLCCCLQLSSALPVQKWPLANGRAKRATSEGERKRGWVQEAKKRAEK